MQCHIMPKVGELEAIWKVVVYLAGFSILRRDAANLEGELQLFKRDQKQKATDETNKYQKELLLDFFQLNIYS